MFASLTAVCLVVLAQPIAAPVQEERESPTAIARRFDGPSIAVSLRKSSRWVVRFLTATVLGLTEETHGTEGCCKYSGEF
jgi:hypothetical protein